MVDGVDIEVECPEIPEISKLPNINFLGITELKGFLDFSLGTPRDCTLSINLMVQIAPLMASMRCLLRILAVIGALKKAFGTPPDTIELFQKIDELSDCIQIVLGPIPIAITIKAVLELIINFLSCFLEQLDSLIKFQAKIDLSSGEGNPVLQGSLECALNNSRTSTDNLMLSLDAVQPLLDMSTSIANVVKIDIELPDMTGMSAKENKIEVISDVKQAIEKMKEAIAKLPG